MFGLTQRRISNLFSVAGSLGTSQGDGCKPAARGDIPLLVQLTPKVQCCAYVQQQRVRGRGRGRGRVFVIVVAEFSGALTRPDRGFRTGHKVLLPM
jgi:hypothetical protein